MHTRGTLAGSAPNLRAPRSDSSLIASDNASDGEFIASESGGSSSSSDSDKKKKKSSSKDKSRKDKSKKQRQNAAAAAAAPLPNYVHETTLRRNNVDNWVEAAAPLGSYSWSDDDFHVEDYHVESLATEAQSPSDDLGRPPTPASALSQDAGLRSFDLDPDAVHQWCLPSIDDLMDKLSQDQRDHLGKLQEATEKERAMQPLGTMQQASTVWTRERLLIALGGIELR